MDRGFGAFSGFGDKVADNSIVFFGEIDDSNGGRRNDNTSDEP